ncbi:hypothetical protein T01_689 [Trichinella spiralis]|uniref:Uncharacterized protein n=1 Tax=Trichinella spiralis TaxID=6334 RepID=A0A0V1B7C7_TRISP|nr:hypothetical protein T01_14632 [Trichinella spiralis]KRY32641.1 hypothetical protein T01_689 [Trichinella spiralis]
MEDCTSLFSVFRQRQSCLATSNSTRSSHLPTERSSLIETVTDISCVVILAIVKDHLGICLFKESISCSTGENLRFTTFEEIHNFTIGNNDNQPTANSCVLSSCFVRCLLIIEGCHFAYTVFNANVIIAQGTMMRLNNREEWPFGTSIETRNREKNETQRGRERKREREGGDESSSMIDCILAILFLTLSNYYIALSSFSLPSESKYNFYDMKGRVAH